MKMTWRWYGEGNDQIKLSDIKQIPGVEGVNIRDDIKIGLPRLLVDGPSIDRFLSMVDDPYSCLTLCSGSLDANPENNVADIVRKHCGRIAFAHIRNVKHFPNGDFSEASHRDCCGDTGIIDILKAYHDCRFDGYIRPDHGRHLSRLRLGRVVGVCHWHTPPP